MATQKAAHFTLNFTLEDGGTFTLLSFGGFALPLY
jgi:hypothetical protein